MLPRQTRPPHTHTHLTPTLTNQTEKARGVVLVMPRIPVVGNRDLKRLPTKPSRGGISFIYFVETPKHLETPMSASRIGRSAPSDLGRGTTDAEGWPLALFGVAVVSNTCLGFGDIREHVGFLSPSNFTLNISSRETGGII